MQPSTFLVYHHFDFRHLVQLRVMYPLSCLGFVLVVLCLSGWLVGSGFSLSSLPLVISSSAICVWKFNDKALNSCFSPLGHDLLHLTHSVSSLLGRYPLGHSSTHSHGNSLFSGLYSIQLPLWELALRVRFAHCCALRHRRFMNCKTVQSKFKW